MDVKIIGRSSGRSATGAAAYRSGEKLQSVAHASYQSGEKLQDKSGKITHDYRKKKGVVHSEILLPDNAPEEYKDRQTLWNTVELSEKRKDAQLAREIIVALPREFDLPEQLEVMREYVQENFVNKGMIADFALHDTGEGNLNSPAEGAASGVRNQRSEFAQHHSANPHAHIMLTMRNVSRDGFGYKNTDWNKKEFLLSYRKAWAHIINNMLVRKGLDIRIDHRTLKAQGLDRKPTIHMGHAATALERQGIRTQRGDYNREIKRHNETRAALMEANYKMRQQQAESKGCAGLETERYFLEAENGNDEREITKMDFRTEDMEERLKNNETLQDKITELTAEYQKLNIWQIGRKNEKKREIEKIKQGIRNAQRHFEAKYRITFEEAPAEIERLQKEIYFKKSELDKKKTRILEIDKELDAIDPEYRIQRKLIALCANGNLTYERFTQRRQPPKPQICDMSKIAQLIRSLDVDAISEEEFQKIIEGLDKIQLKLNKTKLKRRSISR